MITIRHARPTDDLTTLWPTLHDHTMNPEQVVVAVDEHDALLAGALLFHGGHTVAYLGSLCFSSESHQGLIAVKLIDFVTTWCRTQGIRLLGHVAITSRCEAVCRKLGATQIPTHGLMEFSVTPAPTA